MVRLYYKPVTAGADVPGICITPCDLLKRQGALMHRRIMAMK